MMALKQAPTTYAQWRSLLSHIESRSNDPYYLELANNGTINWQSGVADRFTNQLIDTINKRMNQATDQFQDKSKRTFRHEQELVYALLALRKEFIFLDQLVAIQAVPTDITEKLKQLIKKQADTIQESLEQSSKRDNVGRLSYVISKTPINKY